MMEKSARNFRRRKPTAAKYIGTVGNRGAADRKRARKFDAGEGRVRSASRPSRDFRRFRCGQRQQYI